MQEGLAEVGSAFFSTEAVKGAESSTAALTGHPGTCRKKLFCLFYAKCYNPFVGSSEKRTSHCLDAPTLADPDPQASDQKGVLE